MAYRDQYRRQLRGGFLALTVLGLLSLGYGIAVPEVFPDLPPRPLSLGQSVPLPDAGPFGGTVTLYGSPTSSPAKPTTTQLGCTHGTKNGTTTTGLSVDGIAALDRLVVNDRALLPLLAIHGSTGDTITCTGAAAVAAQPLYLIATSGQRDLVPMAAYSFAALALVLGLGGIVTLRPPD